MNDQWIGTRSAPLNRTRSLDVSPISPPYTQALAQDASPGAVKGACLSCVHLVRTSLALLGSQPHNPELQALFNQARAVAAAAVASAQVRTRLVRKGGGIPFPSIGASHVL